MNYTERYDTFERLKKHYTQMANANPDADKLKKDKDMLVKLTDWMVNHLDTFTENIFDIKLLSNKLFSYELKDIEDSSILSDNERTTIKTVKKWCALTLKYKDESWYENEIEKQHIKNCGLYLWPNDSRLHQGASFCVSVQQSTFDTYNSVFVKDYFDWKTFFEKIKHFFKH